MGSACCGNAEKNLNEKDANFSRKGRKGGKAPEVDKEWAKDLPVFTVIKFQAIIRGFLARKRVKKVYGF